MTFRQSNYIQWRRHDYWFVTPTAHHSSGIFDTHVYL